MSSARTWEALSNTLTNFSSQQRHKADVLDQEKGMFEGQAIGTEGIPELLESGSVYNDAFNKSALVAYRAQVKTDIRQSVSSSYNNNSHDINTFNADIEGLVKGMTGEMDARISPIVKQEINYYAANARENINNNISARAKAANAAEVGTSSSDLADSIVMSAYKGDTELQAKEYADFNELISDSVESGIITPGAAAQVKKQLKDRVAIETVVSKFNDVLEIDGIGAAKEALKELQDDRSTAGVSLDATSTVENRMTALISKKENRVKFESDGALKELAVGNIPEDIDALIENAKGTIYAQQLSQARDVAADTAEFKKLPPAQQQALITELGQSDLSAHQTNLLENFEAIQEADKKALKEDGLSLAIKNGVAEGVNHLDLNDVHSLNNRRIQANIASDHYGEKIAPVTKDEAKDLLYKLQNGSANEQAILLQRITEGFGTSAPEVMSAMFQDESGAYVVAGGLVLDGQGLVGRNVLQGAEILKDNPGIVDKSFNSLVDAEIGSTYSETPAQHGYIRDAVRALYAQKMAAAGMYQAEKDSVEEDVMKAAIDEITGGFVTIEWQQSSGLRRYGDEGMSSFADMDSRIEAPVRGMDAGGVEDWLERVSPADIDTMGGVEGMTSEEVSDIINDQRIRLVSVGNGRYRLQNMTGRYLIGKNWKPGLANKPFELVYMPKAKKAHPRAKK